MDKDRDPKKTGFVPAPNCEHPNNCNKFGMCWGAAMITAQQNEKASDCDHPQAEAARREVSDRFDLDKPLKP